MSNSNFNFQNGQGYNFRGNQNYEGFNQDSSYRFQNNDRDLEQSCSQSSMYTKYLELQTRILQQISTLQGPRINSDEFSASQSCSSNSSQLGYIQTTPSSVTARPVVALQGPSSSNELGNQQGPTSPREVLPLTPSLSSSLTLPASEQSVATPTRNQTSTEPRFPANQMIRQNSDSITTYDRAPCHDRVVLKLDSTRSEALQVIAKLKSEFHTYHHREVVHILYERTLIDSLQKLYKDNNAERDSCDFWNRRTRGASHLERIWPQTVSVAARHIAAVPTLDEGKRKVDIKVSLPNPFARYVESFLTIVRLAQPKAALTPTSHRALLSALPVMLSLSPTRGLGVTSLVRPLSSPTRPRRRKLSQLIRPSLQLKAGPTRSEVIYLPLRLQPLLTPRLTSCLLLYPYSHRSGQALEWRWMLSWIRAA